MCSCQGTDTFLKAIPDHLHFTKNAFHVCDDRNLCVGGLKKIFSVEGCCQLCAVAFTVIIIIK